MICPRPLARLVAPLLALALASSCSTMKRIFELDLVDLPESRIANLEALHLPSGKHRYTAEIVGDSKYVLSNKGRQVAGLHIGKPRENAPGEPKPDAIRNPSETCLELLNELLDFDAKGQPRLRSIQISWCARLVDEDPSVLTRERAVLGLGTLGAGLDVAGPRQLALAEPRADADTVAGLLSRLIASFRHARDGTTGLLGEQGPTLAEAIAAVEQETYDLDGARRVLYASASLLQGADPERPETVAMTELVVTMERRTIELALGRAMFDPSGLVRGTAAAAAVACGDQLVYAQMMAVLGGEDDAIGLYRFLGVVLERGFPEPSQGLAGEEYRQVRESWLDVVLTIAVQHPESHVRTRAMQILAKVAQGGPESLREEDWEAWWFARSEMGPEPESADAAGEKLLDSIRSEAP